MRNRLTTLRDMLDLSPAQMADLLMLPPDHYAAFERGGAIPLFEDLQVIGQRLGNDAVLYLLDLVSSPIVEVNYEAV